MRHFYRINGYILGKQEILGILYSFSQVKKLVRNEYGDLDTLKDLDKIDKTKGIFVERFDWSGKMEGFFTLNFLK